MKTSLRYKIARAARSHGVNFKSHADEAVVAMRREISELGSNGIEFAVSIDRTGEWFAESITLPGIITGGNNPQDIDEMIKDAIFTYFGIDPRHCDDSLLKNIGDVTAIKQLVQVTA
jgi:predicted RNase H-like HicB family nuclease